MNNEIETLKLELAAFKKNNEELIHRCNAAVASWDEERKRALREGKPYYVFFKPETIKRLSEMYLQKKYTDKATLEHEKKIEGVHLVESWVVESRTKDKSSLYGLSLPVGSWVGTFKITNDNIWNNYVKTGDVRGFSIEGLFGHNLVQQSEVEFSKDTLISQLEEQEALLILSEIRAILKTLRTAT